MVKCSADNAKAILAVGIPAVLSALIFSFLPREYDEVVAFSFCTRTWEEPPINVGDLGDKFQFCRKTSGETSVDIYIAMLVICAVFVVLGIVFAILNCLSCGGTKCMKVTGRVLVSIGLMCLSDLMVILISVYVVADIDIKNPDAFKQKENFISTGTYSLYQLCSLGLAWLVVGCAGPFLTATDSKCMKLVLWAIGAVISFAIIAIIVAANPKDVTFIDSGAKAMGCVLGVWDLVIFTLMYFFCMCGATRNGCCCRSK